VSIHVVPDVAETWDLFRSTFKAVTGREFRDELTAAAAPRPKQIIWFGNYGASHSNFGIFSLKNQLKALKAAHADFPLELVVVSNNETVYRALVHNCGFPSRYVPWSAQAVYSELRSADAALLTTGDDEFCSIKSSNRVLQALAAGVPVITQKSPALSELEDAIFSGKVEEALRLCLGPARPRAIPPRLQAAQRILPRYTSERLGGIWAHLLKSAIERSRVGPARASGKALIVLEPGDEVAKAKSLLSTAKQLPKVDYDLLISTDLLESQPEFNSIPRLSRTIPRFFSGALKGERNLLFGCSALVVERPSAPIAKLLAGPATQLGVRVLTSEEAANGELERLAPAREPKISVPSQIRAGPFKERLNADGTVDWSFIVHQNARGWILDAICREIGSRQPSSWHVCYHPDPSPNAKNYFFSHYLLLENYLECRPENLHDSNVFVWYTHPREENPVSVAKLLLAFERVTRVIFACQSNRQVWLERGLPEEKTAVVLGAADPSLFRFHERGKGVIGLSSSFYERKNPDCLLEVMKLLPHRQFLLLGRKWNQYALFEQMKTLPNFTYKTARYEEYPELYANFDVFLSMSSLEGGPIPLIEAMMSNAVPVSSNTGFAPDLIRHGENGFLFELDAPAEMVANLIELAFALPSDVRGTVQNYDWNNFSTEVVKLAG
jgi:glycosyltransferase involved in cell wall biosynthesis